jgi:nitroreductase
MENYEELVFHALYSRRSIRNFDDTKEIEPDKITKLLKAGMAAPSACNIQPWEFIIVTNNETITKIKGTIEHYGNYNPKIILLVCSYIDYIPWGDKGIIDCAAALENMMIAAPALGLGTVCIGGFHRQKVKEILEIPTNVEPIGMLYLGYPAETKKPRTKFLEEAVYWEKYDSKREHKPRPGNILEFGPESSI